MSCADESKKRAYNSASRKQFAALKRAERELHRRVGTPRQDRRAVAREAVLPEDRKCPTCSRIVLKSRSWVAFAPHAPDVVECLKCSRARKREGAS